MFTIQDNKTLYSRPKRREFPHFFFQNILAVFSIIRSKKKTLVYTITILHYTLYGKAKK